MAAIPGPSPLKKSSGTTTRTVVVTSGGGTVGNVPPHFHDAAALVSGTLPNARFPGRLQADATEVADLNSALDSGTYATSAVTANSPDAASFFIVHTLSRGAIAGFGDYRVQVAYERAGAGRTFRRTQIAGAWSGWRKQGVAFIPFEVAMAVLSAATAPAAVSATVGTELFVASKMTRNKVDLAYATEIRLVGMAISNGNAAGAAVEVSYMVTEAATWAGTSAGASIVLGTGTAGTLRDSGWQSLATNARVDNLTIAASVSVAFGATAPKIGSLTVFFR